MGKDFISTDKKLLAKTFEKISNVIAIHLSLISHRANSKCFGKSFESIDKKLNSKYYLPKMNSHE
jgi:hypothetical protein